MLRCVGRIGDFLRSCGLIDGRMLARALATQQQLTTVDLNRHAPDDTLYNPSDYTHYQRLHYIPYAVNGTLLTLATTEPCHALQRFAEAHYGCHVQLMVTTRRELNAHFTRRAATTSTRIARLGLRRPSHPCR